MSPIININKAVISEINVYNANNLLCDNSSSASSVEVLFFRPNSGAFISYYYNNVSYGCVGGYLKIIISSPSGSATASIKVYPSGRIEIN